MNTKSIYHRSTLQATERLQLRKQIETLFQTGKAFSIRSLRVRYLLVPRPEKEHSPVRVGFSIPQKRVRKAVARNRKRRLLRESWRQNKFELYAIVPNDAQLHCFIIYNGKEKFTFTQADVMIREVISALAGEIKKIIPLKE